MKLPGFSVAIICMCLIKARAIDYSFPENANQELPPGVPRVVETNGNMLFLDSRFTTPAFQEAGLKLVIEEANKVASALQLPEVLPITKTNLTRAFIGPFGFTYKTKALGNITTSNYWYFVKRAYKFSDVTVLNIDDRCREYAAKYQIPIKEYNPNAALNLATQWLTSVGMDVEGLNHDYDVRIAVDGYWNNVKMGDLPKDKFAPLYIVSWLTKGKPPYSAGGGASAELFLPTKTLLSLSVEDPKFILRAPVALTNLAVLFPGKAAITTNQPVKVKMMDAAQQFPIAEPKWPQSPPQ